MLCVLAVLLPAGSRAQRNAQVVFDDERAPERISLYQVSDDGSAWFLRANDVARLFKATQFWNASSRKVVLGVGRTRFVLTVDTRVVVVDGEPILMHTPIRYAEGFVLVPLEFVVEVASQYTPRSFSWDEREMQLRAEGLAYNVERVQFATAANRTTATIGLTEPLLYHMDTSTPGLVRLKLYGGRVDARLFTVRDPHGLIDGVRAEQTDRDAYLYFDIKTDTRRLRVERAESPERLLLVLEKGDLPEIPDPEFEGRTVVDIVDDTAVERRTFDIRKICIDPGHGGSDDGKVSAGGLLEKDVNLAIARLVRDRLVDELGLEVVMTRDDDELISLTQRTEAANMARADMFLSIHCNAWFSEHTNGFEAYFLAPARSESERALARFENQAGAGNGQPAATGTGDVDFILWDLVQNEYISESSALAEFIQREMSERLGIRSRGVKQANFRVLQGARMPAVLIETAFLSNAREEQMLADPEFHRLVADGIVEAVKRMQERYR